MLKGLKLKALWDKGIKTPGVTHYTVIHCRHCGMYYEVKYRTGVMKMLSVPQISITCVECGYEVKKP